MITAITGGKVITVTGQTYEKATVLTEDGKIKAIGTDLAIPEGAQVIDASGCWVTPGLIDCHTHICNFNEPGTLPGMYDGNEMSGPIQAQVRAMDAVIQTTMLSFRSARLDLPPFIPPRAPET